MDLVLGVVSYLFSICLCQRFITFHLVSNSPKIINLLFMSPKF